MLHFRKLDVYQRAIEFLTLAMECAAYLDVMKLDELLESEAYERGVDLLERIVAMLTKLIDP